MGLRKKVQKAKSKQYSVRAQKQHKRKKEDKAKVEWFDQNMTVLENYKSIGLVLKDQQGKAKLVDEAKRE